MEGVLLSRLFLAIESHDIGVLLAVMPVVDDIIAGDDDMSLAHRNVLWLDCDHLTVHRAANSIAQYNVPLVGDVFVLSYKNAVLIAAGYLLQSLHVLNVLLVHGGVPEDDAHIVALGLAEGEDEGVGEIAPHVVGLNVRKQDIGIDGQGNT